MAKNVFYNPKKAEEEAKEKELISVEQDKRIKYLTMLASDKKFQKYVIEDIIDSEIKLNTDLTGTLESFITSTPEQIKEILVAKSAAKKALENIKTKINASL